MSQIQYPYPEVHIVDWMAGVEWERERIIKLLEDDCSCRSVEECYCTIGWAIELIKGENK